MIVIRRCVIKQFGRAADGGNNHIHSAIVVQVAKGASPVRGTKLHIRSCQGAYIGEGAIAEVSEDGIRLPVVLQRIDIGILADVGVGAKQVFVAVVVEVKNSPAPPAHAEAGKAYSRRVGLDAEQSIAVVPV